MTTKTDKGAPESASTSSQEAADSRAVTRALYAAVGAPIVAGKRAKSFGSNLAGFGSRFATAPLSERSPDWKRSIRQRSAISSNPFTRLSPRTPFSPPV